MRFLQFGFVLALLIPYEGLAQRVDPGSVPAGLGDRIRITSAETGERPTVALFRGIASDSLFAIRNPGGSLALPLSAVQRLEVSRISHARGAFVGAGVGAVAGAAFASLILVANPSPGQESSDVQGVALVVGAPLGGIVGAILGGLMGFERWQPVPLLSVLRF